MQTTFTALSKCLTKINGLFRSNLQRKGVTMQPSERKEGRKEGNGLFNDTINIFSLQLYGAEHMVKDMLEMKPAANLSISVLL